MREILNRSIRIIAAVILTVVLVVPVTIAANPYTLTDGDVVISSGTISSYSYSGAEPAPTDIIIPSSLQGQSVTGIAASAFLSKGLTSVTLPNTLTSIGANAFSSNTMSSFVLPTPSRTGYTLDGWHDGSTLRSAGTSVSNLTLSYTAQFSINQYSVIFNGNGNTGGSTATITQNYNSQVTIPTCGYTRIESTFSEWNRLPDGSSTGYDPGDLLTLQASNVTLYAIWNINDYTINFDEVGGTPISNITNDYGTIISSSPSVTYAGHTFLGWYADSLYNTAITFPYTLTANVTWYAKWEVTQYTVSFNENGGTDVTNVTGASGSTITSAPQTTRSGYSFGGWYKEASFSTAVTYPYTITANATWYAKWNANTYSIVFNGNGSDGGSTATITQNTDTQVTLPACGYTKAENTFVEWNTSSNGNGTGYQPSSQFNMPAGGMNLYAIWHANLYTITLEENGGDSLMDITEDYGTTILAVASPEKEGYTFKGWYTSTLYTSKITLPYTITQNVTWYAKWEAMSCDISFNGNGYTSGNMDSATYNYNDKVTLPQCEYIKTGHLFKSWNAKADGTGTTYYAGYSYTVLLEEITFYAIWEKERYAIYLVEMGGDPISNLSLEYQDVIETSPEITRQYYIFAGWYSDSTFEHEVVFPYIVQGEQIWYARWVNNERIITFDINGGTSGYTEKIIQEKGTEVTIPECSYIYSGNMFAHWNTKADGTGTLYNPGDKIAMPDDDLTLYAIWSISVTDVNIPSTKTIVLDETAILTPSIIPYNAENQNVTWQTNNSDIVTVNNGIITGVGIGRAEITVTTEDGSFSDVCIVQVTPGDQGIEAKKGTLTGILIDADGNPVIGANITLYSSPKTIITDSTGSFVFKSIYFQNHTLVFESEDGTEMGRFELKFNITDQVNHSIGDTELIFDFTEKTGAITLYLQMNSEMNEITVIGVEFIERVNQINENSELLTIVFISLSSVLISIILIVIGIRRTKVYQIHRSDDL